MKRIRAMRDALNHRLSGRREAGARAFYTPALRDTPPTPQEVEELEEELDRNGMRGIEER